MTSDDRPASQRVYWCFISYRHADNKEPGRQWATWLHQALETYEVPSDLVGTVNDRGETIPERIFPVFRDEEELPVNAELVDPIYRALEASKYLLVICSPRAVVSSYVAGEILYFKKLGREDRVLAAIVAGEPNASRDLGKQTSGFSPGDECFPEPLRHRIDAEGHLLDLPTEPIAADFRLEEGGQGWTSPEAYRLSLQQQGGMDARPLNARVESYRKRCELMKLKIIAGVLGVSLGSLTKRDQAYQLALAQKRARTLRRWLAAVGMLAVMAITGGLLAYKQQIEVRHKLAESDFRSAITEIERGDTHLALASLARALRTQPGHADASIRSFSLLVQRTAPVVEAGKNLPFAVESWTAYPEADRLVLLEPEKITILTLNGFVLIESLPRPKETAEVRMNASCDRMAVFGRNTAGQYDAGRKYCWVEIYDLSLHRTGARIPLGEFSDCVLDPGFSFMLVNSTGAWRLLDAFSGEKKAETESVTIPVFSSDGGTLYANINDDLIRTDLKFKPLETLIHQGPANVHVYAQSKDGRFLLTGSENEHQGSFQILDTANPLSIMRFTAAPVTRAEFGGTNLIIETVSAYHDCNIHVIPLEGDWLERTPGKVEADASGAWIGSIGPVTTLHEPFNTKSAISDDGRTVVFLTGDLLAATTLDPVVKRDSILSLSVPWDEIAPLKDERFLVSTPEGPKGVVFQIINFERSPRLQTKLQIPPVANPSGNDEPPPTLAQLSPDGSNFYISQGWAWNLQKPAGADNPRRTPLWDALHFNTSGDAQIASRDEKGLHLLRTDARLVPVAKGETFLPLPAAGSAQLAFNPSGTRLATVIAHDKTNAITVYDPANGLPVWTDHTALRVDEINIAENGQVLRALQRTSGDDSREAEILQDWNLDSGSRSTPESLDDHQLSNARLCGESLFALDNADGLFFKVPGLSLSARLDGLMRGSPYASEPEMTAAALPGRNLTGFHLREGWPERLGYKTWLRLADATQGVWLSDWTVESKDSVFLGDSGLIARMNLFYSETNQSADVQGSIAIQQLFPPPDAGTPPAWWPDFLELLAGCHLGPTGAWEPLDNNSLANTRMKIKGLLGQPHGDIWCQLAGEVLGIPHN